MSKRMSVLALAAAVAVAAAGPAFAATDEPDSPASITAPYVEGQLIVGFTPGTPALDKASSLASVGAASSEQLSPLAPDDRLVKLGSGRSVGQALTALRKNPNVRYADPDYIVTTQVTSNDTYFTDGTLWGMYGDSSVPANARQPGRGCLEGRRHRKQDHLCGRHRRGDPSNPPRSRR